MPLVDRLRAEKAGITFTVRLPIEETADAGVRSVLIIPEVFSLEYADLSRDRFAVIERHLEAGAILEVGLDLPVLCPARHAVPDGDGHDIRCVFLPALDDP